MTELISIGLIIIIVGFAILLAGIFSQVKSKTKVEGGGIVFIGPFPIFGAATNKQIFYLLLIISVILILAFFVLGRKI